MYVSFAGPCELCIYTFSFFILTTRFAYETGFKCLYPNLPEDFSLVVNHREVGENYQVSSGPHARVLSNDVLSCSSIGVGAAASASNAACMDYTGHFQEMLRWSLLHLPTMGTLAQWQFDFHLRRLGSTALRSSFPEEEMPDIEESVPLHVHHWHAAAELLESEILPNSSFLHIEPSPLLRILSHNFWTHIVTSQNETACHSIESSFLPQSRPSRIQCVQYSPFVSSRSEDELESLMIRSRATVDVVVLNALALSSDEWQRGDEAVLWPHAMRKARYLLVLGPCSTSPTEISLRFRGNIEGSDGMEQIDERKQQLYVQIESICRASGIDKGAVLFR